MGIWSERTRSPLFITRVAAFSAVGVVVGLALMTVPNIELVTAVCFAAGYLLGPLSGLFCGGLAEALYAGFHPMGSSLGFVLIAQILGMAIVGYLGAVARLIARDAEGFRFLWGIPLLMAVGTLQFDLLTNLAFSVMAGFSVSQTLVAVAAGLPFAAVHLLSNLVISIVVLLPLLARLTRIVTP